MRLWYPFHQTWRITCQFQIKSLQSCSEMLWNPYTGLAHEAPCVAEWIILARKRKLLRPLLLQARSPPRLTTVALSWSEAVCNRDKVLYYAIAISNCCVLQFDKVDWKARWRQNGNELFWNYEGTGPPQVSGVALGQRKGEPKATDTCSSLTTKWRAEHLRSGNGKRTPLSENLAAWISKIDFIQAEIWTC